MTEEMLTYEDTLRDIEKTLGAVPSFMKFFSKEKLVHDWPSCKCMGEIDTERARFLLSTDEMMEEMLSENRGNIVPTFAIPQAAAEAAQEESVSELE